MRSVYGRSKRGALAVAIQGFTRDRNSSVPIPECVTATISIQSFSVNLLIASRSPVITDLNGSVDFHSGCSGASLPRRYSANMAWVYNGCSVQRVPSWSKVAMRSFGSTYLGLDFSVVSLTKDTIA